MIQISKYSFLSDLFEGAWHWLKELPDLLIDIASEFLSDSPQVAFWMLIVFGALFLFGFLANQNWAIDPANSEQRSFLQRFGRTKFRLIGTLISLLAVASGVIGLFYYKAG